MEISYEELRRLQQEERESAALSHLPDDFYERVGKLVSDSSERLREHQGIANMKEFENMVKIIRDIRRMREEKILFRALRSFGTKHDNSDMISEEHELYARIVEVLSENKKRHEMLEEKPIIGKTGRENKFKKVKILKDVPLYNGVDNRNYGPFDSGDEKDLPTPEAEWLVKGKFAEYID